MAPPCIIQSVSGKVRIPNLTPAPLVIQRIPNLTPLVIQRNSHFCQVCPFLS